MSEAGVGATPGPSGGLDSLVDGAFAAMEADGALEGLEGASQSNGKQAKPKGKEGQEDVSELDEDPEESGEEEGGEESDLDAESGEDEDEPESTKGTKDDPLTVKDLPEDKYIKLKIDGKEEVVSLRELADGHIREQTFHAKIKEIKDLPAKIDQLKSEFAERLTGTKSKVNALLSDAGMLFNFYSQDPEMEAVGLEFAKLVAKQAAADKENPIGKQQRLLERQRERLRAEREEHERTTREQEQRRRATEGASRRAAELKPAWEAALKETGFPAPTQELFELVNANVAAATKRAGKPVSADEFKAIALRAIKFLGLQPGTKKPAPAPKPTKAPEQRRAPAKNPHKKGTIDHLLFGVKPRRV